MVEGKIRILHFLQVNLLFSVKYGKTICLISNVGSIFAEKISNNRVVLCNNTTEQIRLYFNVEVKSSSEKYEENF